MKISLVGYGRMGKKIQEVASTKAGIEICSIIDPQDLAASFKQIDEQSVQDADVAIVFTHPDAALKNIKQLSSLGKKMVIGTTGWYDKLDDAKRLVEESDTGLIWSGNFSIGVNIFFRAVRYMSRIMDKFDHYDAFVHEYHHNQKADSPSGTALMLGNIMLDELKRKSVLITDALARKIEPQELHVSSTRAGHIIGTHSVGFDCEADSIELTHRAKGREGFALGALVAAEWIKNKQGFYHIDDMMKEIINSMDFSGRM